MKLSFILANIFMDKSLNLLRHEPRKQSLLDKCLRCHGPDTVVVGIAMVASVHEDVLFSAMSVKITVEDNLRR